MRILLTSLLSITLFSSAFAQDTTWVQTFTFDSITNRHDQFTFPASLDTQRFEKVLMYYKLKCSPLTTWDQYDCGEWDYLTYTRVFDHTGDFDSVKREGAKYLSNFQAPLLINYNSANAGAAYANIYQTNQSFRTGEVLQDFVVNIGNSATTLPFHTQSKGGTYQFLVTAQELLAAGVQAGDLQSLSLFVSNLAQNEGLSFPKISLLGTNLSSLNQLITGAFTEVYNQNVNVGTMQLGANRFLFFQPFAWNGTQNIIVQLSFDSETSTLSQYSFDAESGAGLSSNYFDGRNGVIDFDGTNYSMLELSDTLIAGDVTIEFWAKGNANNGTNTTILEAYDTLNNRVLNIHMPWSNNNIYWDAGNHTGYDRINKPMTAGEIDNNWNHWAFVKKQSTGQMFIYKNGHTWHSGSNLNRPVGYIHRFVLGANRDYGIKWKGQVDEFRVFKAALDSATILANFKEKIDNSHPNYNALMTYYDFDDVNYADDRSPNDYKLMLSDGFDPLTGSMIKSTSPVAGVQTLTERPVVAFGQGTVSGAVQTTMVSQARPIEPVVIFEQAAVNRHFEIVNSYRGVPQGSSYTFSPQGAVVSTGAVSSDLQLINDTILYHEQPYEIVKDVEIARYITPYGINFDLGPNGFSWIYDVTDYQQYLHGVVDLAAHNTQELLDLKFAFVKGIPPRDVHKREPIWADWRSYNYGQMANDVVLQNKPVVLSDTSQMFKIKTRMSGHGQVGNAACCEWVPNDHRISIDGTPRYNWNIWQTTECGDNPNIGQGGTWPYAREGWCPGDRVKDFDFELTPFVQPGDTVNIDYSITAVPPGDPGTAGGNYIGAFDLISYSAPNFQNDAAIVDVLNPNNWEYYSKFNPTCSNPRVVLRNTGATALTSCFIRCWITYGNEIQFNWTGNLGFMEEEVVEIPVNDLGFWMDMDSTETFTAYVSNVNGTVGNDEYLQNSVKQVKFDAPEVINGPFFAWLTTNNKAVENSYKLIDGAGNIIFQRNQLANQTQYKDTFDLAPGCYSIIIEDTDHDGLSFWYSAQVEGETNGQMRLRYVGGSYIELFPGDFGHYHRYDFSVGFGVGLNENKLDHEIAVFPNPTSGETTIEISGFVDNEATLEIYDMMGRKWLTEAMTASQHFAESHVNLGGVPSGAYIARIVTKNQVYTKQFIKQ
ncbi:MAG: hypothetical protein RL737_2362 [Bacteroidota bacterium]